MVLKEEGSGDGSMNKRRGEVIYMVIVLCPLGEQEYGKGWYSEKEIVERDKRGKEKSRRCAGEGEVTSCDRHHFLLPNIDSLSFSLLTANPNFVFS